MIMARFRYDHKPVKEKAGFRYDPVPVGCFHYLSKRHIHLFEGEKRTKVLLYYFI